MKVGKSMKHLGLKLASAASILMAAPGFAQDLSNLEVVGIPEQDGLWWQPAVTEVARDIYSYEAFLFWLITIISAFVMVLLLICLVRYNKRANKTPATFTHNTKIEVAWTIIPVFILLAMLPPSLKLLNKQMIIPEADVTIKAIGNQWYWTHEYVDHGFGFDSIMLQKDELADHGYGEDTYLLATDTAVVVPVNKTVVVQVTGADVIHAWTIPSFGVKQDAVPGRLAELWFKAEKEGVYFGQCSELCGKDHSYMPITVKVVSQEVYEEWLDNAIAEYAGIPRVKPDVQTAQLGLTLVTQEEAKAN